MNAQREESRKKARVVKKCKGMYRSECVVQHNIGQMKWRDHFDSV